MRGAASRAAWAKTNRPETDRWLPLWCHLDDTAAVAEELWDKWLPAAVRRQIAGPFSGDETDARQLTVFLAGVHDIGKVTPAFAVQVPHLADRMREVGLEMPIVIPPDERRRVPHALAGEVLVEDWLVGSGWEQRSARQLGIVVGGHHGVPPGHGAVREARLRSELIGSGLWRDVQRELLDRAADRTGAPDWLATWRSVLLPQPVQVLLSGIVIVADWIASNPDFFPLVRLEQQPDENDTGRFDRGWRRIEMPEPWSAVREELSPDQALRSRFDLPGDAVARPVQVAAHELAGSMDVPGLMVVEAPMGEGKTEAALLAAEVLAARSGAGGVFVALPTQATTDAMFLRVLSWLSRLPDAVLAGAAGREYVDAARSVMLAHGKATLNSTFRELRAGWPRDVGRDETDAGQTRLAIEAVVHLWMTGRKKGPLADFVVGTIDQVLFTSLKARHLALRHLGMARKVVILDEVHAFDVYMNVYLFQAVEWLGAYGVPVVMLSATLPDALRADLVAAYQRGLASGVPRVEVDGVRRRVPSWVRSATEASDVSTVLPAAILYPTVTVLDDGAVLTSAVPPSGRRTTVALETAAYDDETLVGLLDEALVDGGCVLVVRNTVRRAQQAAALLREKFGADVSLAHSRFMGHDRARKDEDLRRRFGPPGPGGTSPHRPPRAVVIATQVVEQSLDVDFDLLITDLAPMDLLLQRIGRMHRHERGAGESARPRRLRCARCVVVGVVDWDAEPPRPDRGGEAVYGRHALYRAAALVTEIAASPGRITLPDDIAPLVQRAYGENELGPDRWQPAMAEAHRKAEQAADRKRSAARTFRLAPPGPPGEAIVGWLDGSVGEADDTAAGRAQVRDTDDSIEALLLLRSHDGQLRVPDWVDERGGELVPVMSVPDSDLARVIAGCAIRLQSQVSRGKDGDVLVAALERTWIDAWKDHPLLGGQLILPIDDGGTTIAGHRFRYDPENGLEVTDD